MSRPAQGGEQRDLGLVVKECKEKVILCRGRLGAAVGKFPFEKRATTEWEKFLKFSQISRGVEGLARKKTNPFL